jgi:hypothetical protein
LENIQNNLSGSYVLGTNIDASGFNFAPIGGQVNPFTGTLNGNGFTISNLSITASGGFGASGTLYTGMFGAIGAGGSVQNIYLNNTSINASAVAGGYVGGIAGINNGTISQAYTAGQYSLSGVYFGGIAGSNSGLISQSSAIGSLTDPYGGYAGGIAGFNAANITQSFAAVTLSYPANGGNIYAAVGGLVGVNSGSISQSYSAGTVAGTNHSAGGLTGLNGGTISQSYATGLVAGANNATGGVSGGGCCQSVTSTYWDTQSTNQATDTLLGTVGLTTAQLQSGTLPSGFNPSVWAAVPGLYPNLLTNSAHNTFVNGFQALTAGYVVPGPSSSPAAFLQSQQLELTMMDSTLAVAQTLGTTPQSNVLAIRELDVFNVLSDFFTIFQTVTRFDVDPFLPVIVCPQGTCLLPITNDHTITASSYEVFSYNLTINVDDIDLSYFIIGNDYITNSSILNSPSFSRFEVASINGNDVTLRVDNISNTSVTPLPPTVLLFLSSLVSVAKCLD